MKKNNIQPKPCQLVIFGGTGDLTHRKLLPALYNLTVQDLLPEGFVLVAIGRRDKTSKSYRQEAYKSVKEFSRLEVDEAAWWSLEERIYYQRFDFREDPGYLKLNKFLQEMDEKYQTKGNRIFYLAVAPDYFGVIVDKLETHGILKNASSTWPRVVIEKPFGHDLKSARHLNDKLTRVFSEDRIYRIDHYLGKEMLQNIMVIRFANTLFEPLWNNKYIDNVQIISGETAGVGNRGGYYERAGALRDMVQNHMLQLLTLTAIEPPGDLETESIRDEKVKVLKKLADFEPDKIDDFAIRGQYGPGYIKGEKVFGYREEERTSPESNTETFVALKLFINNWRWAGVPFYIKTGKRLPKKSTEVIIEFNSHLHPDYLQDFTSLEPNLLVIRIQPREGVYLQFNAKEPGSRQKIIPVNMDFCQNCQIGTNSPEAYERLLYDIMLGDQTLFTRWDEVEYSWRFIDKLSRAWERIKPDFPNYAAGSTGPKAADELLVKDGRKWWEI